MGNLFLTFPTGRPFRLSVSSFGGTKALGGLVSVTLLFAMMSNLLLLPSLLLSLESKIANKKTLKKPTVPLLPLEDLEK